MRDVDLPFLDDRSAGGQHSDVLPAATEPASSAGRRALLAVLPDPRTVGARDGVEDAVRGWMRQVRAERTRARADLQTLLRLAPQRRAGRVRSARSRFRSRAFAELLVDEVRRRCRLDPAEAVRLADLVPLVVLWIPGPAEQRWSGGLELAAAAWRANALRIAGELRRADRSFAALRAEQPPGFLEDRWLAAEVASLEASLRIDQERWDSARRLLAEADALYRSLGADVDLAKVAVKRGIVEQWAGDPSTAVTCFRRALARLDPDEETHLFLCALSNLSLALCDAERHAEAERLLADHETVYRQRRDGWSRPLEAWLRGRIAAGVGRPVAAESHLCAARDEYLATGDAFRAGLVSFDLAILYLEQGRSEEVREVARSMQRIFAAEGLAARAFAAFSLFQRAVAAETVTVAAVRAWRRQIAAEARPGAERMTSSRTEAPHLLEHLAELADLLAVARPVAGALGRSARS
jgi:tetratricopeptide (TPR) repeat protein